MKEFKELLKRYEQNNSPAIKEEIVKRFTSVFKPKKEVKSKYWEVL